MTAAATALVDVGETFVVAGATGVVVDRPSEAEVDGVSEADVGAGVEKEG